MFPTLFFACKRERGPALRRPELELAHNQSSKPTFKTAVHSAFTITKRSYGTQNGDWIFVSTDEASLRGASAAFFVPWGRFVGRKYKPCSLVP